MKLKGLIVLFSTSYPLLYETDGLTVLLCSSHPLLEEAEGFESFTQNHLSLMLFSFCTSVLEKGNYCFLQGEVYAQFYNIENLYKSSHLVPMYNI